MNKHPESYRLNRPWIRIALLAFLVVVSLSFLAILLGRSGVTELAPKWSLDYRQYWGASRVLVAGGNPYDVSALTKMEVTTGVLEQLPVMMWNPPWTMVLTLPFAALPFGLSALAWLIVSIFIILGCGIALWRYYDLPKRYTWLGIIIAGVSFPVFWGLQLGQSHAWLLLGITGFLVAERAKRDGLAGAALVLLSIKPHVAYLFLACVLWWVLRERRWRVLVGGAITLLIMCLIVGIISPPVFTQYLDAARQPPIYWRSATLGTWLRILIGFEYLWLQFIPTIFGVLLFVAWAAWPRINRGIFTVPTSQAYTRAPWNWPSIAPWALLASALTAPYGWSFDKIILLPVVFAYLSHVRELPRWQVLIAALSYVVVQILMFLVLRYEQWAEPINYVFPVLVASLYVWQQCTVRTRSYTVKEPRNDELSSQ